MGLISVYDVSSSAIEAVKCSLEYVTASIGGTTLGTADASYRAYATCR